MGNIVMIYFIKYLFYYHIKGEMHPKLDSFKICILYPQSNFKFCLDQYLRDMGYTNVQKFMMNGNSFDEILKLESIINKGFDLYFNICEGHPGQFIQAGAEIVRYLTYANVPFIGTNLECYYPSRYQIKEICIQNNIKTPAYQFVYDFQKDFQKLTFLKFPLIVKHHNGQDSLGLTLKSKVTNLYDLAKELKIMLSQYGGSLVQQFIIGRQFTCLIVQNSEEGSQPYAYEPVEFIFKNPLDDFKYEEIKMVRFNQMQAREITDKELREHIKRVCIQLFKAMNFISYARVDLRMNENKELYVLEINSLPSLFNYKQQAGCADLILFRSEGGHRVFIQNQIKSALLRYNKNKNLKNENVVDIKQICLKELRKQQKVMALKLSNSEKSNILFNLYRQSFQKNNRYITRLSKQILKILKENCQIGYIFNEDQVKQLEL